MILPYSTAPLRYVAAGSAILPPPPPPTTILPAIIQNGMNGMNGTESGAPSPTSIPGYYHENWSSLIGIVTAIVGNVLISFALNMQRYAHIRLEREWREKERGRKMRQAQYRDDAEEEEAGNGNVGKMGRREYTGEGTTGRNGAVEPTEEEPLLSRPRPKRTDTMGTEGREIAYKQKSYLRSPFWWAGIILMTLGECGNFLAYGFAPASIVSPLGVVALISNCIIAPIMLKEPFRLRDGLGVLIAVGGAVTVVLSASDNNPKLGPEDIWKLITTWEFETYFGVTVGVICVLMWVSGRFGEKSVLIDLGLVGLFGGYTALSTKGVASMLSYTLWRAITFPVTYLLVATLVFTAIMQIKYVNRALQRFDATQVIPVQFVLFTLSVILGSAILYRDFERTSADDAGKFVGGCALTFLGVWCITSGRHRRRDDDEENSEPGDEDAINLRYQDDVDTEEDEENSRRSSTVRAASPPIIAIDKSSTHGDDEISTPTNQAQMFLDQQHSGTSPTPKNNTWAQVAAGAPQPTLTLDHPPPPPPHRHSSPVLPTTESSSTTGAASASDTNLAPPRPSTPTRGVSDNILPTTPGTAGSHLPSRLRRVSTIDRQGSRNSIPGPLLASPLSTTLSAMVADLQRGNSLRGLPYDARRRGTVLGFGSGEGEAREGENGRDFGEALERRRTGASTLSRTVTGDGERETRQQAPGSSAMRSRSISDALGDLWRGARGTGTGASRSASGSASQDEEQGNR